MDRLDEGLAAKWTELTHQYGEAKVNGTVVFINDGRFLVVNGTGDVEKALSDKIAAQ